MSPIVICIALFVVMLVLFFTNKIPMSFTALAAMVALVLFGCLDSSDDWQSHLHADILVSKMN